MNRISMVGSPALAEDHVAEDHVSVSGPAAAVPDSGTAVGGLGEVTPRVGYAFEFMLDQEKGTRAALERSCSPLFLYEHDPELVLLGGRPLQALCDHASKARYHLVLVVSRAQRAFLPNREPAADAPRDDEPMLFVPAAPAAHE